MSISTQCEEYVCRPDVKVVFHTAGELRDHYSGEVLDLSLRVTETDNETTWIDKSGVPYEGASPRNRRQRGSSTRTCSTDPREIRSGRELRHEMTRLEFLHLNTT